MVKKKKISVIIQARYNSSRFEGKVLAKIKNKSLLEILINRIKKAKNIDQIIVACTKNSKDEGIINICKKLKIKFYRGSESNVISRYFFAAKKYGIKRINYRRMKNSMQKEIILSLDSKITSEKNLPIENIIRFHDREIVTEGVDWLSKKLKAISAERQFVFVRDL